MKIPRCSLILTKADPWEVWANSFETVFTYTWPFVFAICLRRLEREFLPLGIFAIIFRSVPSFRATVVVIRRENFCRK